MLILIPSLDGGAPRSAALWILSAEGSVPTTHGICRNICGRGPRWRCRGQDHVGFVLSSGCQSLVASVSGLHAAVTLQQEQLELRMTSG